MPIFKEIAEHYLFASLTRFKKVVFSQKSHKKVVLEQNGKKRIVFIPNKVVKCAQKYFLSHYLEKLPCSNCCYSYQKGKSIVDMASAHVKNNYYLHLDIKHYFDNMDFDIFKESINTYFNDSMLNKLLSDNHTEIESKGILTFRGKFRQGCKCQPKIDPVTIFEN